MTQNQLHTSSATTDAVARTRPSRPPLYLFIAAWAVLVMVASQFSMIALVPVLVVLIGSFTDPRARILRWWTSALAVAYAIPLAILNVRPDPAASLSKDMHPVWFVLILLAAVALLVRMYIRPAKR
ncbi:hypothetical protein [Plantibacter sp. YIM 135249]|uniref:hypothetical protein n=1 Tax=Plantibacter sp. YIM 135249 TaxID=3423918 RepID=UPI003D350B11